MGISARDYAVWAIRAEGAVLLHRGDGEEDRGVIGPELGGNARGWL